MKVGSSVLFCFVFLEVPRLCHTGKWREIVFAFSELTQHAQTDSVGSHAFTGTCWVYKWKS